MYPEEERGALCSWGRGVEGGRAKNGEPGQKASPGERTTPFLLTDSQREASFPATLTWVSFGSPSYFPFMPTCSGDKERKVGGSAGCLSPHL